MHLASLKGRRSPDKRIKNEDNKSVQAAKGMPSGAYPCKDLGEPLRAPEEGGNAVASPRECSFPGGRLHKVGWTCY